ncbi:MAG: methyl-accepting chemotaxis protein [Nitrosomonadales bacterium]|nr:methyl-accepting chemotaxis protein [Nitrosomonadales bacterium]
MASIMGISLTVRNKIILGNALLLALLAGSLGYLHFSIVRGGETIKEQSVVLERLAAANDLARNFMGIRYWLTDAAVSQLIESEDQAKQRYQDIRRHLQALDAVDPKRVASIQKHVDDILKNMQAATSAYIDDNRALGNSLLARSRKTAEDASGLIQAIVSEQQARAKQEGEVVMTGASNSAWSAIILLAVSITAGIGLAVLTVLSIIGPLNRMRTTITEVEKNCDFTRRIQINTECEVGQTAKSFNQLMATLQQAFGQVHGDVAKVSDAAQILSSASNQVAAGSTAQNEATSAMAAAVEEMTVSINHISNSAREAADISRNSGKLSSEGGEITDKAAAEMSQIAETVRSTAQVIEELGQQSNRISSIVQVIKEVADQTNLLALNAAIEAARAGEQGRGFAVVADEVRKLAERTTKATEEITQMIGAMQHSAQTAVSTMGSSVDQVNGGLALANQAGLTINQVKDGVEQVVGVVNDISSALTEQSGASNDIATQVEKVAQMTEENSAAAAEAASAANNLHDLADTMQAAVNRFKI